MLDFFSPAVVRLRRRRDVAGLIQTLHTGSLRERRAAANALILIPDPRAAEPLTAALRDSDALVRQNAALALGELQGPRPEYEATVDPLVAALADTSPSVRAMAASALGRRKDGRAVPALIALLDDGDDAVRTVATAVLASFDDARAREALAARRTRG
jgi:HEAT repeat protein